MCRDLSIARSGFGTCFPGSSTQSTFPSGSFSHPGAGLFAGLALLLAGASTAAVLLGFGAKERLVLLQAARSLSGFVVLLCAWDVFNSAAHGGSVFGAGNALLKVPGLSAHASLSLSKVGQLRGRVLVGLGKEVAGGQGPWLEHRATCRGRAGRPPRNRGASFRELGEMARSTVSTPCRA